MSDEPKSKEESLKNWKETALHLAGSICDQMRESFGLTEAKETIGVEVEIDGLAFKATLDFRDEDEQEESEDGDDIDDEPDVPSVQYSNEEEKRTGFYKKFEVTRLHDPEGRHKDCRYFVLDLEHDPHAAAALYGYADSLDCKEEYPELMRDLNKIAGEICQRISQRGS